MDLLKFKITIQSKYAFLATTDLILKDFISLAEEISNYIVSCNGKINYDNADNILKKIFIYFETNFLIFKEDKIKADIILSLFNEILSEIDIDEKFKKYIFNKLKLYLKDIKWQWW